jgi:hypothetical protein
MNQIIYEFVLSRNFYDVTSIVIAYVMFNRLNKCNKKKKKKNIQCFLNGITYVVNIGIIKNKLKLFICT